MFWKKMKGSQTNFFVSIGAGFNQIPLIAEATKLGLHVIGVDYNATAPGFIKCDLKIQESIENHEEIYTKLRELLVDGDISGIMTKSYGSAIRTTSYLANKFNIPFMPFERSNDFINKKKMKSIFQENDLLTPKIITFNEKTNINKLPDTMFPIITKPNIGHAKIDVKLIKNVAELLKIQDKIYKKEQFIFEEFIVGEEIISIGIIHNKKFYLIDITDKKTTAPPYFVDLIHISPSKYYHLFEKIEFIGQKIADAFDISTSPLIMELVIDKDENIYLIEAVPEFGGEFLPDVLIPARTGYNFIGEAIKAVTNTGFTPPIKKKITSAVVVKYIIGEKGILASCNPEDPQNAEGIIFSRIFKEIGSETKKPVTNLDRLGVVVVKGRTIEEAIQFADRAANSFNLRIK